MESFVRRNISVAWRSLVGGDGGSGGGGYLCDLLMYTGPARRRRRRWPRERDTWRMQFVVNHGASARGGSAPAQSCWRHRRAAACHRTGLRFSSVVRSQSSRSRTNTHRNDTVPMTFFFLIFLIFCFGIVIIILRAPFHGQRWGRGSGKHYSGWTTFFVLFRWKHHPERVKDRSAAETRATGNKNVQQVKDVQQVVRRTRYTCWKFLALMFLRPGVL